MSKTTFVKSSLTSAALLGGLALAQPELTVYTYSSFVSDYGPGAQLTELFEAQCDCKLNWVSLEDGVSVLNRLRLEGERTQADLVLGFDNNLLAEARATGLLRPHGLDLDALTVPGNWSAELDVVPFDYGYFAFIYDQERLSNPPSSMAELLASDLQVIYQDPRSSTPGLGLLLWMKSIYGDQAEQAWQQMAARTLTVSSSWWDGYALYTEAKEGDLVLSYSTSPAYHQVVEGTDQYQALHFAEGHFMQVELAAITTASKQPELAAQFLQMLISPEAQAVIPVTNWMLPVVAGAELPEAFDQLIQPEIVHQLDPELVQQNRAAWVREWLTASSR